MNKDIARPLDTGSSYTSAYIPPVTDIGLLALTPVINLNIKRLAKFGATAHAIVKIMKRTNVEVMINFRPYVSDIGPKRRGPRTYPRRYTDSGKIWSVEEVILNSLLMNGIALDGSPEPRVLLNTTIMPIATIPIFRFYDKVKFQHLITNTSISYVL
jgi:hypothetical protein